MVTVRERAAPPRPDYSVTKIRDPGRGDYPSPNHGDRRGQRPELIVLHYTGMASATAARERLCDPLAEVSAHWLVSEDGRTEALVPEGRRAWHAGAGAWQGREDVNSRSIGIEIVNPGDRPFPARQMDAVAVLVAQIMARWRIGPAGVIGHSDMAPDRKSDPGPRFDWEGLARQGLALWPCATPRELPLEASLDAIGYPAADPAIRLAAFRLRFRPWAQGGECGQDRRVAAAAATLFAAAPRG
ncbi:N-acetylmuramoyl-L-alanine amidase [Paracoccus sp. (in: a-proteobacteria)]|uniref:N-acetylmuramoyl-L-alanine amidase n=1 Tax=Paracoccus sp. TaxID=267 RepID=UPI003A899DD4